MSIGLHIDGIVFREGELLAKHVVCRVGGPCDAFIVVHRQEVLAEVLTAVRTRDWNVTILGSGSRVVVRDSGLSGAVIRLGTGFSYAVRDGAAYEVGAATPVPVVVALAAAAGLGGIEELAAVPGSIGASLLHDEGWAPIVQRVTWLHRGKERDGTLAECQKAGKTAVIIGARLGLRPDSPEAVTTRSNARMAGRVKGPWIPPGSWFSPPKRGGLRDVLERAALPGVRLRDVAMPLVAPELLVNLGEATAKDVALLHQSAIERVVRETGVELPSRMMFLGRA